jgi:hypothetical protein
MKAINKSFGKHELSNVMTDYDGALNETNSGNFTGHDERQVLRLAP